MSQNLINKAAQFVELRRLGMDATGIPTISDVNTAKKINELYEEEFERRLKEAKAEALESARKAFERECIGFQASWGSNKIDVAKLGILNKTIDWLKARTEKYTDTLPRMVNLNDTYKSLSDGAVIEIDRMLFTYRRGFGDFVSSNGTRISGNFSSNKRVKLVSHNL